jgi:hypothetical protein
MTIIKTTKRTGQERREEEVYRSRQRQIQPINNQKKRSDERKTRRSIPFNKVVFEEDREENKRQDEASRVVP